MLRGNMDNQEHDLMNERINVRGEIENMRAVIGERSKLYDERFVQNEKNTALAMTELQRRLDVLNHAHEQAREKEVTFLSKEAYQLAHDRLVADVRKIAQEQNHFVRTDKYEDKLGADEEKFKREAEARTMALFRIDEKFAEYIKRYEADKRETDILLAAQKGAAEQAKAAAVEQGRKTNRNIAVVGLALALLVAVANWIPSLIH